MKGMNLFKVVIGALLTTVLVTSCDEEEYLKMVEEQKANASAPVTPEEQQEMAQLKVAMANEQQLRMVAETKMEKQSEASQSWQLATFGLGVLCVVGFFAGTSIGSRGRRHAELSS